jgi:hypothetical protein
MLKTKCLGPGFYDITSGNHKFELERTEDNQWALYEAFIYSRQYMQHFATKREAIAAIIEETN